MTWDWGNNTWENLFSHELDYSVHVFTLFFAGRYNILPERFVNPYIGAGIGILWLRRIYGEDYNFIHAPSQIKPGLTQIIGFEFKLSRKFYFTVPAKFYLGLMEFDEEDRNQRHYNGGVLWGLNIGIGLNYYW